MFLNKLLCSLLQALLSSPMLVTTSSLVTSSMPQGCLVRDTRHGEPYWHRLLEVLHVSFTVQVKHSYCVDDAAHEGMLLRQWPGSSNLHGEHEGVQQAVASVCEFKRQ